jgi:2-polyprenyl-3-methyl-5-hydroxy-6-metoxy-1,4-benzoquinol methylase
VAEDSIRAQYVRFGAQGYYEQFGAHYRNPHELAVRRAVHAAVAAWDLDQTRVLDLACGSGEVTLALRELGARSIDGLDPFTGAAYQARTGQSAEALSFEAIASGALDGRRYSLVACSYALHLLDPSRLPRLAYQLSRIAGALLVFTPHKRPQLRSDWGWVLTGEMVVERVRARNYQSMNLTDV